MPLWRERLVVGLLCTCTALVVVATAQATQGCTLPAVAFAQFDIDKLANCTALPSLTIGIRDCSVGCNVTSLSSLRNLQTIYGSLTIQCCGSLSAVGGVNQLTSVGGSLVLYYNQNLATFGGFSTLIRVNGSVEISQNVQLETVSAFARLQTIGGNLLIANNPALTNISGFAALQVIKGEELAAGNALNILYNGALADLRGLSALVNVSFGTVHIEGNTRLCYAGYPLWTGENVYLPRSLGGDKGIDWRQKLKGPLWQFTWNIIGIPTLVIQQNGISCATASCDSSCGKAGCLGPNDPNLCGACVQVGATSTCDTTNEATSSSAASCGSTTVAAVLGVFLTLITLAVVPLCVAFAYLGWKAVKKIKQRGAGSFDVHVSSSKSATSDLALIFSDDQPASPQSSSSSEVIPQKSEASRSKSSERRKETVVVMRSYKPLQGGDGEPNIGQPGADLRRTDRSIDMVDLPEEKTSRKGSEKGKETGVAMLSYKPLQGLPQPSAPNIGQQGADLRRTDRSIDVAVDLPEEKTSRKSSEKGKETGVVMRSYKPLQGSDGEPKIDQPETVLRRTDRSITRPARPVSRPAPPPPEKDAAQKRSLNGDGAKPGIVKSESKRRLSFLGDGLHTSMSEESLSELATGSYEIQMNFPHNQLKTVKQIGTAQFGQVHLAEARGILSRNKKLTVVLKQLKEDATTEEREEFTAPVEAMKSLKHPNVLQLLGMSSEDSSIMVILEYCAHGSFKTFLIRYRPTPSVLKEDGRLIRMACEMAAGLTYLHSMNIAHNDFAVRNCMVTYHDQVKIGDYGLARQEFKEDYYSRSSDQLALPIRWMAPELIVVEARYNLSSRPPTLAGNMWAFGISLWEVASLAQWPYEEQSNEEVVLTLTKTRKCTLENPLTDDDPFNPLYEIMRTCWVPAAKRPTMTQVTKRLTDLKGTLSTNSIKHGESTLSLKENFSSTAAGHMKNTLQSFTSMPQLPTQQADKDDDFDLEPPSDPWNSDPTLPSENTDDFMMDPPKEEEFLPLPYPFEDHFPPQQEDLTDLDALQEPEDDFILELPPPDLGPHLPGYNRTVQNPLWEMEVTGM